tara:strand:- start:430 stop:981 length:552 start_codon:yes stop_codon:yes gene_type:complete
MVLYFKRCFKGVAWFLEKSLLWFMYNHFLGAIMSEKPVNDAPVKPSFDVTFILYIYKSLWLCVFLGFAASHLVSIAEKRALLNAATAIDGSQYALSEFSNSFWSLIVFLPGLITTIVLIVRYSFIAFVSLWVSSILPACFYVASPALLLIIPFSILFYFVFVDVDDYRLRMVPKENHKDQAGD